MAESTSNPASASRQSAGAAPNGRGRSNKSQQGGRKKLLVLICILVLVLLLPLTGLAVYVNGYEGIFPNLYVGDLELSGSHADEALARLNQTYNTQKLSGAALTLTCKDSKESLTADALELEFRNQATAAEAFTVGREGNLLARTMAFIRHKLHKTQLEPAISYNKELLMQTIDTISKPYETQPVGFTFDITPEQVTLHAPAAGVLVNREEAVAQIEAQMRAMAFAPLTLEPVATEPEPLDFDTFYKWLTSPAEDAYYTKGEDGKITVAKEKLQCTVEKNVVRSALDDLKHSDQSTVSFAVTTTEPAVLSAQLEETLYRDKLGSYTTHYSGTAARNNNVQLATSRIDGFEMMPGDEFSYDQTILSRTAANGYQAAPVYVGNKVESGMGGGICQPSSTLYCAALYANLEILERHNHSLKVGYLPPGLDATIAEGALDLRLRNNTPYPIKIAAQASGGVLTFSIWGYNPENYSVELLRSSSGEYTYQVTRVVKKDGAEVKREQMGSSQYSKPEPSETPKPTAVQTSAPVASAEPAPTPTPEPHTPVQTAPPQPTVKPTQAPVSGGNAAEPGNTAAVED